MVTSRDVAELAGVSQATVSRVMSSSPKLSPATRARVQAAMETLGYVPHAGAQAMKTRRTNTIGVVVADLTNPFYPEVLDELSRELDAAGFRVVIWNAGGGSHHDALKAIREHAVDGVIFTTATEDSLELQAAIEKNSPIVLINRVVEGLECDQVTSSNTEGGAAVADYLLAARQDARGFHRRRCKTPVPPASAARASSEKWQNRATPFPEHFRFHGGFSHDISAQITNRLLARADRPQSHLLRQRPHGLRCPGRPPSTPAIQPTDCWVIGYDDVDMAAWESFSLTTVRQPSREMARAGAEMMMQRKSTRQDAHRRGRSTSPATSSSGAAPVPPAAPDETA